MQVKNESSKKKTEKRGIFNQIGYCISVVAWVAIVIFVGLLLCDASLSNSVEIWNIIAVGIMAVCIFGCALPYAFIGFADIKESKKIYIIAIAITTITMIVIPLILQGVYHATKNNIFITEDTQAVSKEIIYLKDENEAEQRIKVTSGNDIITVQFDANGKPYVEVMQYCTTVTTDNQNPWGRKFTETIKGWKQYEFHLPASKAND